jgi:hypothetical protein
VTESGRLLSSIDKEIMMDFMPLLKKVTRVLRMDLHLQALADECWEIAPAEQSHPRPAVFLEDEIANIVAVTPYSNLPRELRLVHGAPVTHRATMAFRIRSAKLLDGTLYANRYFMSLTPGWPRLFVGGSLQDEPPSVLTSSRIGSRFFGDWLLHDLSANLLAQELGRPVETARKQWAHEPYYRERVGYDATPVHAARFAELTVMDDIGLNAHKRARYRRIRTSLREGEKSSRGALCFLKRGGAGSARALINEDEVESMLHARGFVTLEPEKLTARALASELRDSRIVVGVEGSHLSHAVYGLAPGGALLALQPPRQFNACYKVWLDAQDADLRFAFVVGAPVGENTDFRVDVSRLQRLLDLL